MDFLLHVFEDVGIKYITTLVTSMTLPPGIPGQRYILQAAQRNAQGSMGGS